MSEAKAEAEAASYPEAEAASYSEAEAEAGAKWAASKALLSTKMVVEVIK